MKIWIYSLLSPFGKGGWRGFKEHMLSYDKQLFMIYKISPCPSFPKRGKREREFCSRGGKKGRNKPLNTAQDHN